MIENRSKNTLCITIYRPNEFLYRQIRLLFAYKPEVDNLWKQKNNPSEGFNSPRRPARASSPSAHRLFQVSETSINKSNDRDFMNSRESKKECTRGRDEVSVPFWHSTLDSKVFSNNLILLKYWVCWIGQYDPVPVVANLKKFCLYYY